MKRKKFIILFFLITYCYAQTKGFAQLQTRVYQQGGSQFQNGFTQIASSKYFNIYSKSDLGVLKLIRRLDINSEYLLFEIDSTSREQAIEMLGAIVDAIFLEACDVLHMYVYHFKVNIKLCQNQKELKNIFLKFYGRDLKSQSFYIHNTSSIYINMQNIRPEILAYGIARAIISHYFVALPPEGVQEVMSQEVGVQIRKLAK